MEILSIKLSDFPVGLVICGRSRFEYIISKKSQILLSLSYFSKSTLKYPRRTTDLFPLERFLKGLKDSSG